MFKAAYDVFQYILIGLETLKTILIFLEKRAETFDERFRWLLV